MLLRTIPCSWDHPALHRIVLIAWHRLELLSTTPHRTGPSRARSLILHHTGSSRATQEHPVLVGHLLCSASPCITQDHPDLPIPDPRRADLGRTVLPETLLGCRSKPPGPSLLPAALAAPALPSSSQGSPSPAQALIKLYPLITGSKGS